MADVSGASATGTPTPPPGLINAAPGSTTMTPGTSPNGVGSGAPVTGYNPSSATAATAAATPYNPSAFTVTPNQTVAGQIQNIIASGSPLMTQAESNAKNLMNQRGLINSSQAVTAAQSADIAAATPIATADAGTYATAATNTAAAENTAKAANAGATNTAALQNAAQQTSTAQFNSGQTNAALSGEAAASNTVANTAQTIQGQLVNTMAQIAGQKDIAGLQATTQQAIAQLQANTSLSVEEQQTQSAQIIAAANNQNALLVQQQQNAGNLANIQANGVINTQITNLTNDNKTLLQTSSGAAQIYNQALSNLNSIIQNPNMTEDQKSAALNDGVTQLNDALSALQGIANNTDVTSLLNFSDTGATNGPPTQAQATQTVTSLYQSLLGRNPDPTGLATFTAQLLAGQGVPSITAQIQASPEYQTAQAAKAAASATGNG